MVLVEEMFHGITLLTKINAFKQFLIMKWRGMLEMVEDRGEAHILILTIKRGLSLVEV